VRRSQRIAVGIVLAALALVMSFLNLADDLLADRMSWTQLLIFVVAAVVLLSLLRRRALPGAPEGDASTVPDNWFWLRLSAVSIVVMGAVMWLCVIAFALAGALGQHSYGWLLLLPFGLWGLRRQVPAIGKLWRADPSALYRRQQGEGGR